jgi:hypothetical protein
VTVRAQISSVCTGLGTNQPVIDSFVTNEPVTSNSVTNVPVTKGPVAYHPVAFGSAEGGLYDQNFLEC